MATITEDYVSYEVAKLLKEKGFDKDWVDGSIEKYLNGTEGYSLPTLATAMKWLREVHNISVRPRYDEVEDEEERLWYVWFFDILSMKPYKTLVEIEQGYSTYEEACEAAIKYCLEHLI